jgi:hypothetical protein
MLNAQSALAFFSNGKINDDFSYRSLHVEILEAKTKSNRGGCYLVGEILNNTHIVQENVSVTFYAFDFFDHSLWKQTVRIDIVDPFYKIGKGVSFRNKLRNCEVPAKFQFKVTGVKTEDAKKAILYVPNPKPKAKHALSPKPNTGNSESKDSLQKSDSDAVDVITTPVAPIQNYLIILTNGKEISTDSCRELGNDLFFNKNGGEVRISKDKIAEIRKLD